GGGTDRVLPMSARFRLGLLLAGIAVPLVAAPAPGGPKMVCRVVVPEEFKSSTVAPNGDPERVRYTKAYEAFWWNCVLVRAAQLDARCPMICSGTPAATAGCAAGAGNADEQIERLLQRFSAGRVQSYLKRLGS